ncbi:MAG: NifU family protein [Pseudomonadota bacterium]
MFIQTETTPNPATLKFLPGQVVMEMGTADFVDPQEASQKSPLASKLFEIDGVMGVFFGYDFVTVTKSEDFEWAHLKPSILANIMEHLTAGEPVIQRSGDDEFAEDAVEEFFEKSDAVIVQTIKELIETRVRPAVAQDGGDITFRGFRDGTVFLKMKGACAGCPSSTATLKHGIQNLLRHFVPEVEHVESM